jgi:hypothetical protein
MMMIIIPTTTTTTASTTTVVTATTTARQDKLLKYISIVPKGDVKINLHAFKFSSLETSGQLHNDCTFE